MRHSYETFFKNLKDMKTHHKIYSLLPVVVGKVVVWGGRDNSVCGLSFGCSHGRTIAVQLEKN
jgi:hypothetical protein